MTRAAGWMIGTTVVWVTLAACGGGGAPPLAPEGSHTTPAVALVLMRPPQLYMDSLDFSVQLYAQAYDEDSRLLYSSAQRPSAFAWSSSSATIASVNEAGSVTSASWGTVMITATHQSGGVTGTARVRVEDAVDVAWSTTMDPASFEAGVVIGPDGTIYAGSSDPAADRSRLYAISPEGETLWQLGLPFTGGSTPAIGSDGTLYIGSRGLRSQTPGLLAIDPEGTVRWVLDGIDGIVSSPALGSDGTIYVAGGKQVYAVGTQGEIQWIFETTNKPTANFSSIFEFSSPAIASEGTIHVGGTDGHLYAINPDGSLRWTSKVGDGDYLYSSPAIGPDGTIHVGSADGRLYAINPEGSERWSVELDPTGVSASPSIGPDGTIYAMAGDLYAIERDGRIRWSYPAGSHGSQPTPVVGADGAVYYGSFRGMTALGPQGHLLWTHPLRPGDWTVSGSPAIGLGGELIVVSRSISEAALDVLVESDSTNGGFEEAAWPSARGGRANTGRTGG